jgi:hypothetical protein
MAVEKQPPRPSTPNQEAADPNSGYANANLAAASPGQRYYATETPVEEKRRSFWRRSIKPEDIGVAVSPDVVHAGSPVSIASQRATSQLLPAMPNYSLWPAPLRTSQQIRMSRSMRPESTATEFEEDATRNSTIHQAVTNPDGMAMSGETQHRGPRIVSSRTGNGLPTDPRAQMYALERARESVGNSHMPLTPTYDNGNAEHWRGRDDPRAGRQSSRQQEMMRIPPPVYNPAAYASTEYSYVGQWPSEPNMPSISSSMTALPNTAPNQLRPGGTHYRDRSQTRAAPSRSHSVDSAASGVTSFDTDDDTAPEQELDRRLKPPMLSPVIESPARTRHDPSYAYDPQESPLRDLTYPRLPRSAAIARQADALARPLAAQYVNTTGPASESVPALAPAPATAPRHSRAELVRQETSFFVSQSTSSPSTGVARRDASPTPSLLAKRRGEEAAARLEMRLWPAAAKLPSSGWRVTVYEDEPQRAGVQEGEGEGERERAAARREKPKLGLQTTGSSVENLRVPAAEGGGREGSERRKRGSMSVTPTRHRSGELYLTVDLGE